MPGELAQLLPNPTHFEQAAQLVTPDMVAQTITCGPDLDRHLEGIRKVVDAGFDEVYLTQVGADQEEFFQLVEREILPAFA